MSEKPQHPHGKPENVLKFSAEKKVVIEDASLKRMFEHPDVKNRKIVAFSIIGAYRKGKSFFLDYCLRFLYANYKSINFPSNPVADPEKWMGEPNEALLGFSWRSGSTRDTTGIIMWNDVFLYTVPTTGERLAIVVMDTQGLFDNETSPMDNSRIFALGTLISSIQILNLSGVVQEDQLQYLQFATEFARFAASDSHGMAGKPFQNLMFLIRDWVNYEEHPFGTKGGEGYLKKFLDITSSQKEELRSVRKFIRNSFEDLNCSLLPYPDNVVAGSKKVQTAPYSGSWDEMDKDFKEELEKLIKHLLAPGRLVVKKINGEDIKSAEFKEYIDQYFKLFQSDELPEAQSIYESTVEKQMNLVVQQCLEQYKETIFKNQDLLGSVEQIPIFHNNSKNNALLLYKETKKMGNANHHEKFQRTLEELMEKVFQQWSDHSEKNLEKIEEEKERTRLAIKEKEEAYQRQLLEEKLAAERLAQLEKDKAEKSISLEKYKMEKEIAEMRLKAEKERVKQFEDNRKREEELREKMEKETTEMRLKAEEERSKAEEGRMKHFEDNRKREVEFREKMEKEIAEMKLKMDEERKKYFEDNRKREVEFKEKMEKEIAEINFKGDKQQLEAAKKQFKAEKERIKQNEDNRKQKEFEKMIAEMQLKMDEALKKHVEDNRKETGPINITVTPCKLM